MADDPETRARNGLRYVPRPDPTEVGGQSRSIATRAGGSGPPSIPGGRSVAMPDPPERRGLPAMPEGREVATRGTTQPAPQTVIDGDPTGPRDVRSTRVTPQVEGPMPRGALPAPAAPVAESVASRAGRVVGAGLRGAGRLVGPLGAIADLQGSPAGETPEEARDPAAAEARAAAQYATQDREMPAAPMPAAQAPAAPAARPRPTRGGSAGRPGRARQGDNESDDLNARSLRAIRGEASDGSARDENIRRRMAEAGRETYATGGVVGKRDGLAIKGRTKARFC